MDNFYSVYNSKKVSINIPRIFCMIRKVTVHPKRKILTFTACFFVVFLLSQLYIKLGFRLHLMSFNEKFIHCAVHILHVSMYFLSLWKIYLWWALIHHVTFSSAPVFGWLSVYYEWIKLILVPSILTLYINIV